VEEKRKQVLMEWDLRPDVCVYIGGVTSRRPKRCFGSRGQQVHNGRNCSNRVGWFIL
jgi:hypothetical protein